MAVPSRGISASLADLLQVKRGQCLSLAPRERTGAGVRWGFQGPLGAGVGARKNAAAPTSSEQNLICVNRE